MKIARKGGEEELKHQSERSLFWFVFGTGFLPDFTANHAALLLNTLDVSGVTPGKSEPALPLIKLQGNRGVALAARQRAGGGGGTRREAAVADERPPPLNETHEREEKLKSKHMEAARMLEASVHGDGTHLPKRDETVSLSPIWTESYGE